MAHNIEDVALLLDVICGPVQAGERDEPRSAVPRYWTTGGFVGVEAASWQPLIKPHRP
jgi:hypothetical protein